MIYAIIMIIPATNRYNPGVAVGNNSAGILPKIQSAKPMTIKSIAIIPIICTLVYRRHD